MNKETNRIAYKVIDLQIKALKKLKNSLDISFDKSVNAILKCKAKVIICGVGKSGIIADKISATLSSVGTPSFTVSANDCSHGDLGKITNKDILILISNSGNTVELKNIIKYAKANKIFLIGIATSISCQLGDLFFSFIKRKAFIKDSGKFLPGHGGALDRLDGIFFGIPLGLLIMKQIENS